jgi:hypothetical protein
MAMKTTQSWGWLAAGVMALGLNGFYQDGGAAWAHRAVNAAAAGIDNRAEAVLALATGRADWFLAKADLGQARGETSSCKLATVVTRVQTRMLRRHSGMEKFEEMSARQEAALTRLEGNRVRIEAHIGRVRIAPVVFQMPEIPEVSCPRVRVSVPRVNVPRVNVPKFRIPAPVVHVDAAGSGTV